MKKKTIIIIVSCIILLVLLFYGIVWYFTPKPSYFDRYPGPLYYESFNVNEETFIDSLEKTDYIDVEIAKPIIGLEGPYGTNTYQVYFKTNLPFEYEKDSLIEYSKVLAIELYRNVISDMFIYDMESVYLEFNFCEDNSSKKCQEKHFEFDKDSLEKWCGFKVIEVGNKKYKRVYH